MRIEFKKIEISNFMAFSDEVFEFDKHNGLNLVCGKNNDILGAKNGSGKCLDPKTKISIQIDDDNILSALESLK